MFFSCARAYLLVNKENLLLIKSIYGFFIRINTQVILLIKKIDGPDVQAYKFYIFVVKKIKTLSPGHPDCLPSWHLHHQNHQPFSSPASNPPPLAKNHPRPCPPSPPPPISLHLVFFCHASPPAASHESTRIHLHSPPPRTPRSCPSRRLRRRSPVAPPPPTGTTRSGRFLGSASAASGARPSGYNRPGPRRSWWLLGGALCMRQRLAMARLRAASSTTTS